MPPILIAQTPNAGSLNYRYLASDTRGLDSRTVASYLAELGAESGVGPDFLWAWSETVQKSSGRAARNSVALVGVDTARLPPEQKERILSELRAILGRLNDAVPKDWTGETSAVREVPALAGLMPAEWRDMPSKEIRGMSGSAAVPTEITKRRSHKRRPYTCGVAFGIMAVLVLLRAYIGQRGPRVENAAGEGQPEAASGDVNLREMIDGNRKIDSLVSFLCDPKITFGPAREREAVDSIRTRLDGLCRNASESTKWVEIFELVDKIEGCMHSPGARQFEGRVEIEKAVADTRMRYRSANYKTEIYDPWNELITRPFNALSDGDCETIESINKAGSRYSPLASQLNEFYNFNEKRRQGKVRVCLAESLEISWKRAADSNGDWAGLDRVDLIATIGSGELKLLRKQAGTITRLQKADNLRITVAEKPEAYISPDKNGSDFQLSIAGSKPSDIIPDFGRRKSLKFAVDFRKASFSIVPGGGSWQYTNAGITASGTWSFDPPLPELPTPEAFARQMEGDR